MEIKIAKKIDESYINEALLVWKLNTAKSRKDTVIILIMCIAFFTFGILRINMYHSFWNPWTSLGMALAFIAILFSFDLENRKLKVISKAKECIEIFSKSENCIEYLFTDKLFR